MAPPSFTFSGADKPRSARIWRAALASLAALLLARGLPAEIRSETPTAGEFPEVAAAYRPVGRFVYGNTILVGDSNPASAFEAAKSCDPIPTSSPILAFEENSRFLCVTGDLSAAIGASSAAEAEQRKPALVRRLVFLNPSVFVLGCGSGANSIFLASKGFDVTAIDIAPTALAIAEAKAKQAGVQVRWVLADVLKPPDFEPFDLIFDRGCYHNVRYVDAAAFVETLRRLSRPGTRCLILSCDRESAPGVREHHMRGDFAAQFDFEWLRQADIQSGPEGQTRRPGWSAMLRRK